MDLIHLPLFIALALPLILLNLTPPILHFFGRRLKSSTRLRRLQLIERLRDESIADKKASTLPSNPIIIGFFHPYCDAGGGGERVLWAAIRSIQSSHPDAISVVYTGDHVPKPQLLQNVTKRFSISLDPTRVDFIYLHKRNMVDAATWPRFTLAGQSLGSIMLVYEALGMLVPDIFIDTMGYAFATGLVKVLAKIPTGAYVHYPTISTDMLSSLSPERKLKLIYWRAFAWAYGSVGRGIDVVATNSSWTAGHIRMLWRKKEGTDIIYPPCNVTELEKLDIQKERERMLLCIAQFRPEKNHELLIKAFAESGEAERGAKLVLVGSVRHEVDEKRVYMLRLLAHELLVDESVEFIVNASWDTVVEYLGKASIGVNGMWNEHFGIGVVEYQAAGLISVVHDSGGPRQDIVVETDGGITGFHATDAKTFAKAYSKALSLLQDETLAIRKRAKSSAKRFSDEVFDEKWQAFMSKLFGLLES